jgi:exosortase
LGPLAVVLAWRTGLTRARPSPVLGIGLLAAAVLLRYVSDLAAEPYTMRLSMLLAAAGLIVFWRGLAQVGRWWLPASLLVLSIPLPQVVIGTLAFPLQLKASQLGAALLAWRDVPVQLAGNVLHLPGQSLFVTEACSGLRSLTALLSLGLLIGGLWLKSPVGRVAIVVAALPVAMALNGLRIFLTGFLVHFVDPALGEGVMHYSEGWAMFLLAFLILGGVSWAIARLERAVGSPRVAIA